MGKYQDLFRKVSLGIEACATEADCAKCPYKGQRRAATKDRLGCELQLSVDKVKLTKLMTYLDEMDKEVEGV